MGHMWDHLGHCLPGVTAVECGCGHPRGSGGLLRASVGKSEPKESEC